MRTEDIIAPVFTIIWGVAIYVLLNKNRSRPELWPRIWGLGGGTWAFCAFMTASILREPISEVLSYTVTNLFLSLPYGILGYFGGREYARRRQNKN